MNAPQHPKIQAHHFSRKALVYVRQSTLHQVFAHGESTARQYGLAATAQDLGWPDALIEVIDQLENSHILGICRCALGVVRIDALNLC